ncbi:hypothetical protein HPB50_018477 [Hyalomma asiaticum]|uniref:Uncharacterized protein n=1 Tax=Hyalomma asiaticum TaxID=266040 RepID=A0ACB7TM95_HYAAI|nr:hypothetical protein HPB50_018477 [Hyalomma asiaticum]
MCAAFRGSRLHSAPVADAAFGSRRDSPQLAPLVVVADLWHEFVRRKVASSSWERDFFGAVAGRRRKARAALSRKTSGAPGARCRCSAAGCHSKLGLKLKACFTRGEHKERLGYRSGAGDITAARAGRDGIASSSGPRQLSGKIPGRAGRMRRRGLPNFPLTSNKERGAVARRGSGRWREKRSPVQVPLLIAASEIASGRKAKPAFIYRSPPASCLLVVAGGKSAAGESTRREN